MFKKVFIERLAFALGRRLSTGLSNLVRLGAGSRPSKILEFRARTSLGVGEIETRFRGFVIGESRDRFCRDREFERFDKEESSVLSGVL